MEYIVKNGDTLWDISAKHLGSPLEWPRLWRYNNRKEIIAITNKKIDNPDLIYPGQKILIPLSTKSTKSVVIDGKKLVKPTKSLKEQLPNIKSPMSFSYKLDDIKPPLIKLPNAIVEIKMQGSISLSSIESYPVNYVVNNKQLETKVTSAANKAFSSLIAETKLAFDQKTKNLTLGTKIISKSTTPNTPSTAVGVELTSNSPLPKLKYEIHYPTLKGKINEFSFIANKIIFTLEVTLMSEQETGKDIKGDSFQPSSSYSWDKIFAIGLYTSATAIIVGTIIEDYLTLGAGVADDPASFAIAAGLSTRGALLWNSTNAIVQRAVLPAVIRVTTTVVPVATLRYAH